MSAVAFEAANARRNITRARKLIEKRQYKKALKAINCALDWTRYGGMDDLEAEAYALKADSFDQQAMDSKIRQARCEYEAEKLGGPKMFDGMSDYERNYYKRTLAGLPA